MPQVKLLEMVTLLRSTRFQIKAVEFRKLVYANSGFAVQ